MSFMVVSFSREARQTSRNSFLPRCFSEGCVLQRHAGVAWLPMASCVSRGGGLKDALRSPGREAAGRCSFGFRSFGGEANPGGKDNVKGALAHGAWRGLPLRLPRQDYIAWPSKDGKPQRSAAGQGSGPRAAPTPEASETLPRPWEAFQ